MSKELTPLELDEMLLGLSEGDADEQWARLVSDPVGDRRWAAAVLRRAELDALVMRLHAHPWLAGPLWRIRVAARRFRRDASAGFELAQLGSPLFAQLGQGDPPLSVEVAAGETRVFSVAAGRVVEVRGVAGTVYYATASSFGALPSLRWKMEPGESPVLLAVAARAGRDDLHDTAALMAAIDAGEVLAAVVLEEALDREISR